MLFHNFLRTDPPRWEQSRSVLPETCALSAITDSHGARMMTLKPDTNALKSISGLSTLKEISSLTLPESAFLSKAALLLSRDSILVWIVRERLFNPEFAKLLPHLYFRTAGGRITLEELVNYSPNAE